MQLDGYIRVSKVGKRKDAGERFISPEDQRSKIEGWAKLRGVTIANWETDLDRTGKILERPGLDRILARIERGETGGIAVAYIDRFSRADVGDALKLIEWIDSQGGSFAALDYGLDPTTPFGEFGLTLLLGLARLQSRQKGERWYTARSFAVERGTFVGGYVPAGLRKREDGRLERDPTIRHDLIRDLFGKRAGKESWSRIAAWLSEELGRPISIPAVRALIRNRVYLGEVNGGQGLVNRQAHEPLVSRSLFEAANAVRGVVPARSGRSAGLLSGLLRCAGCRYAMKASMNKNAGEDRLEYRCKATRAETTERCPSPATISAHLIDGLVLEEFRKHIAGYRLAQLEGSKEVEEAEAALLAAETELDATLDTRLAEALGSDSARYLELVGSRQEAVDAARGVLADATGKQIALPKADIWEIWPDLDLHERRRLLASALDCVFVRRGRDAASRTHLCWRGEAPELPRSGARWTPLPFDFPA
jgi:DNA invertase Pin-like site-specific DNA recombinase